MGGFTLIELMIVVAIIGILAAIAYPGYQEHIRKSRRVDAKSALLDLAAREERFFSVNNRYTASPQELGYAQGAFPIDVLSGSQAYYTLNVTAVTPVLPPSRPAYTATAIPKPGPQSVDSCGIYQIDELGNQTNTPATPGCW